MDIDDSKRTAQERDALIAALEQSNQELDRFAYVASHDLKAPLRGISNLAQWLVEDLADRLTEESRGHLSMMQRRAAHMNALIEGILRYARAGRSTEGDKDVAVGELLNQVVELLAPAPGVTIEIAGGMPALHTSEVALQQIFLNLMGNAVKHAGREDPHVTVRVRDGGERWIFSVADNGPGIAPEYQDRVWALFQTLPANDSADNTGIGLSIVRKTVESRKGTVWLESTAGKGSTFFFSWPKQEPAHKADKKEG